MKPSVHIILPAYNEAANLLRLLPRIELLAKQIPHHNLVVFIINDGSEDDTLKIARETDTVYHKIIVDIQPNQGLANAIRTGIQHSIKELADHDIIITMDADDSHDPALIQNMISEIEKGNDLIIASRYQSGAKVIGLSPLRKLTSWGASIAFRLFAPIEGVKDYTCGFRAYRAAILKKALAEYQNHFIEEQGFACMVEILLKLNKKNIHIREIPMILRYDRKAGNSKMKLLSTITRSFRLLYLYSKNHPS